MLKNTIRAGLGLLLLLTITQATAPTKSDTHLSIDTHETAQVETAPQEPAKEPVIAETTAATTTVQPKPAVVEPPKPAVWSIANSPHGRVPVERINQVLAHLQARGLTKEGAAYLTGNFISESYLEWDNCHGDGGTACGIAQWRGGRQAGMPQGLIEQIDWALDYEMPRHANAAGYGCLCAAVKSSNINVIKATIKLWEVYGLEGGRYQYGAAIYAQL